MIISSVLSSFPPTLLSAQVTFMHLGHLHPPATPILDQLYQCSFSVWRPGPASWMWWRCPPTPCSQQHRWLNSPATSLCWGVPSQDASLLHGFVTRGSVLVCVLTQMLWYGREGIWYIFVPQIPFISPSFVSRRNQGMTLLSAYCLSAATKLWKQTFYYGNSS